jgi:hypothetical protein
MSFSDIRLVQEINGPISFEVLPKGIKAITMFIVITALALVLVDVIS